MKNLNLKQAILLSAKPEDAAFVREISQLIGLEILCFESLAKASIYLGELFKRDQCLIFSDVSTTDQLLGLESLLGP